jgi:DNA (cytosine-5)-methyltransferase 1
MTLRLFEAFAGYGSQRIALNNLSRSVNTIGISEINKTAISAYIALHGPTHNFGNISLIDPASLPDFDIFTYSFPCQDISCAGYKRGLKNGSGTRSSLLWDCEAIITAKKPKYLLLENVKNLTSSKFYPDLQLWLDKLAQLGYTSIVKILNSKEFGIPQNRERVFVLSSLSSDLSYSSPKTYTKKYLKDFLDKKLDSNLVLDLDKVIVEVNTLSLLDKPQRVAHLPTTAVGIPQSRRIYSDHGISVTLDTKYQLKFYDSLNGVYRKASGNEYLRLMGLSEIDIEKLYFLSNAQKASLAGNSIVVPVLEHVFRVLLDA